VVYPDQAEPAPRFRVIEPHVGDIVMADVHADPLLDLANTGAVGVHVREAETCHNPFIRLLELVAAQRVAKEIREVREQVELIRDDVGARPGDGPRRGVLKIR